MQAFVRPIELGEIAIFLSYLLAFWLFELLESSGIEKNEKEKEKGIR